MASLVAYLLILNVKAFPVPTRHLVFRRCEGMKVMGYPAHGTNSVAKQFNVLCGLLEGTHVAIEGTEN